MKYFARCFLAILILAGGVGLWATGPGASSGHFLLVNNNDYVGSNFGTALKLLGNPSNLSLESKATFPTGGISQVGSYVVPTIQMINHGPDTCLFLADGKGMDIASFLYPNLAKVGNYFDSGVTDSQFGIVLVANGNYLFAGYSGQTTQEVAVWRIERGCALTLLNTYSPPYGIFSMAVAPNGKALMISYATDFFVGSYGIGPGGVLTGPYLAELKTNNGYAPWGVDITADSKYAIFDSQSSFTAVDVFAINADGSLGNDYSFGGYGSLGSAKSGGFIRLSLDERFLFVNDDSEEVTTLNFTESPVINVTFTGCLTTLRVPKDEPSLFSNTMAMALPAGSGGALYVAEVGDFSHIGTFVVNPSTGCTTEASTSPFQLTDNNAALGSIAAWPPRPF